MQTLLAKLQAARPWAEERPRVFRALAALEESGAPAARDVLQEAARGALEDELKQAAQDALDALPAPPKP